jgi:hypothetical protein
MIINSIQYHYQILVENKLVEIIMCSTSKVLFFKNLENCDILYSFKIDLFLELISR